MSEDVKMQAGDNPADYTVDQVQDYLAGADDTERKRVQDAEAADDGKQRKGVLDYGKPADDSADAPKPATADAIVVQRPGTVDQGAADADAKARNAELEQAGVISDRGYIGSDASDLRG